MATAKMDHNDFRIALPPLPGSIIPSIAISVRVTESMPLDAEFSSRPRLPN
jgi:hypothetical protein